MGSAELPPELQFSALLAALRCKQVTEAAPAVSFLLQRPPIRPPHRTNSSSLSMHQPSSCTTASEPRNRPQSRLRSQSPYADRKITEELPLPSLVRRVEGHKVISAREEQLAEQLAAAERVMKDLHKRNKALELRLQQTQTSSHVSCQLRQAAIREEIGKLRIEAEGLRGKFAEKPNSEVTIQRDFLLGREADAAQYFGKYQELREKIRQYAVGLEGEEAAALIREIEETDQERRLYVERIQLVSAT